MIFEGVDRRQVACLGLGEVASVVEHDRVVRRGGPRQATRSSSTLTLRSLMRP